MRAIPREVRKFDRIKHSFSLSEKQKFVLLGTLLGDGSLKHRGNFYRLHVKHALNQISLVSYKRKIFSNITNMPTRVFSQKVKNKSYNFCEFVTLTHPEFSKYRKIFYRGGKKIVPKILTKEFTSPLSLAVWFMDDGSAEYAGVAFNTQCFTIRDVNFLRKVLKDNFGLETTKRRNKNGWIIYIQKKNLIKFEKLVWKYILPEFRYKFRPYSTRLRTP